MQSANGVVTFTLLGHDASRGSMRHALTSGSKMYKMTTPPYDDIGGWPESKHCQNNGLMLKSGCYKTSGR